jgi:hypothetical protein
MSLRRLIPLILLVTGLGNAVARVALPPEMLALRSWEAVTLFVTSSGPFAPNKRYVNPAALGDLGLFANLPAYNVPHSETFTTGSHGYRSWEPGADGTPGAILFGDSFGAGASLQDEDYLCARLAPVFHGPVFFAGYYSGRIPATLADLPKAPYVIFQLSERYDLGTNGEGQGLVDHFRRILSPGSALYIRMRTVLSYWSYSPFEILSSRYYKSLQNDTILPNVYRNNVRIGTLANGNRILFLASEVPHYFAKAAVDVGPVVELRSRVEKMGYRVIVLIVPNKFTVYYPLLTQLSEPAVAMPAPAEGDLYVNVLENKLRAAGVPVLNLNPALRRAAADAAVRNELVYRSDDTHWNPAGVEAAVRETANFIRTLP